jgi:hypothetical protein
LTLFLGQVPEDEGDETGMPETGVGGATLAVFTEIENDLEKLANGLSPDTRLDSATLSRLMKYVRDNVPEFSGVSMSSSPYEHRMLDALVQKRPACFYPHRFFFVAPAAGELTTMTALAALIRQTERR